MFCSFHENAKCLRRKLQYKQAYDPQKETYFNINANESIFFVRRRIRMTTEQYSRAENSRIRDVRRRFFCNVFMFPSKHSKEFLFNELFLLRKKAVLESFVRNVFLKSEQLFKSFSSIIADVPRCSLTTHTPLPIIKGQFSSRAVFLHRFTLPKNTK